MVRLPPRIQPPPRRRCAVLALGLPAHVLVKVLSPAFFARDDTKTPLIATIAGMVVAVLCGLTFGRAFGVTGVAGSISLGAWFCAAVLGWRGAATFGFSIDAVAWRRLPRIVACAAAMGAMLYVAESFVASVESSASFAANLTILGGLVAAGISFYGLLLDLFGLSAGARLSRSLREGGLRE